MKFIIIIILILAHYCGVSFAQGIDFIPSASGNASIVNSIPLQNPALLAKQEFSGISFISSPSKFGMCELNPSMLSVYYKSNTIAIGGELSGFGNSLYNEFSSTAAIAGNLTKSFALGAAIELNRLGIKNYNNYWAMMYNIGAIVRISEAISAGAALHNITGASFPGGDKSASSYAMFGIGIKTQYDLSFDIDGIININSQSAVSFAGRYDLENILSFRLAFRTNPRTAETGFIINLFSNFKMLANLHYHDELGFSPLIGIEYEFK
jgi:hypothetical protein